MIKILKIILEDLEYWERAHPKVFWAFTTFLALTFSFSPFDSQSLIQFQTSHSQLNSNKSSATSNYSQDEIEALGINYDTILVKGVEAFPVNPNYPARQSGQAPSKASSSSSKSSTKPQRAPSGFYRMPSNTAKNQGLFGGATSISVSAGSDPGGSANGSNSNESQPSKQHYGVYDQKKKKKKRKNSGEVSKERVLEAYQNFMSQMREKGYEVNVSEDRFLELSTNSQTGKFDEKSIFEAEGGLQGEAMGHYKNLRRIKNSGVDLDFTAELVDSGKTIFVDHKGMIDFGSLADKGIDISNFPSHETVAFNMGKDSVDQKQRFVGYEQGPTSKSEVLHLYNFEKIRNSGEKPILMQAVLNGAEQSGWTGGIIFLNIN